MGPLASKSFLQHWQSSPWFRSLSAFVWLLMAGPLFAAPIPTTSKSSSYPSWWFERGVIPQKTQPPKSEPNWPGDYPNADDYAAANIGQLKQIAATAYDEFNAHLPGGTGSAVDTLVKGWFQLDANGDFLLDNQGHRQPRVTAQTDNYNGLNLGQLKTVAKPFYDRLIALHYLESYPWANRTADNYAVANLGQLKNLFAFKPPGNSNGDALANWYPFANAFAWTNPDVILPAVGTHGGGGGTVTLPLDDNHPEPSEPSPMVAPPDLWLNYHHDAGDDDPTHSYFNYSKIDVSVSSIGNVAVERRVDTNGVWMQKTSGTDTGLTFGHTYYYRARIVTESGVSLTSRVVAYAPPLNLGALQQVSEAGDVIPAVRQFTPAEGPGIPPTWYSSLYRHSYEEIGISMSDTYETTTFDTDAFGFHINGTTTVTVAGPSGWTNVYTNETIERGRPATYLYESQQLTQHLSDGDIAWPPLTYSWNDSGETSGQAVFADSTDLGVRGPLILPAPWWNPIKFGTSPTFMHRSDDSNPDVIFYDDFTLSLPMSESTLIDLAFGNMPDYGVGAYSPGNGGDSAVLASRKATFYDVAEGEYGAKRTITTLTHTQADDIPVEFLITYQPTFPDQTKEKTRIMETRSMVLNGTQIGAFEYNPEADIGFGSYVIGPKWRLVGQDLDSYFFNADSLSSSSSEHVTLTYYEDARKSEDDEHYQITISLSGYLPGESFAVSFNSSVFDVFDDNGNRIVSDVVSLWPSMGQTVFHVRFKTARDGDVTDITVHGYLDGLEVSTDSISLKYKGTEGDSGDGSLGNNPSLTMPFDEASGSLYRKIALNGRPIPDGKPQAQAESDVQSEQTFVDALTLQLRHDTSDVFIPLSGSDLALTVNRSLQPEVWNLQTGLRPHEQPFRPFGACWNSNLGAHAEIITDHSGKKPDTAYVTDENGAVHTFVGKDGAFVPLPSARHDQSAMLTSFDGTTFTGKYGTKLTFAVSTAQEVPGTTTLNGETHSVLRPLRLEDRLGNAITYQYDAGLLTPITLRSLNAQGQTVSTLYLQYDLNNHITDVWDPLGHNYHYTYLPLPYGGLGNNAEYGLSSVTGPDGKTVYYSYDIAEEPTVDGADTSLAASSMFHCELSSIKDPLGNITRIGYTFDHTHWERGADGVYHHQIGAPRNVGSVTLPGDTVPSVSFHNTSDIRLLGQVQNGVAGLVVAGHRGSTVTDAENHQTAYAFTGAKACQLNGLNNIQQPNGAPVFDPQNPVSVPCIVYYTGMEVTTSAGTESFRFDPNAGLALSQTTDLSNNVTTYVHGDHLPVNQFKLFLTAFENTDFGGLYEDPTSQTNALQKSKTFTYGPYRQLQSVTDENGHVTTYDFDPQARRIRETAGDGAKVTEFEYGDNRFPGTVTKSTVKTAAGDPAWAVPLVTTYQLDDAGRVATQTLGPVSSSSTYDDCGNKLSATDGRGNRTVFQYDARNRLTLVTFPGTAGQALPNKSFVYDDGGNKVKEMDEKGHATVYCYDALNRVKEVRRVMSGGDLVTKLEYNKVNSRTKITDPRNYVTQTSYDDIQRPTQVTEALGTDVQRSTQFEYGTNSGGSVFNSTGWHATKITNPRLYVTTVAYDGLYRTTNTSVGYAAGQSATTGMEYDDVGNVTQVTDPLNHVTKTVYDHLNRPTAVTVAFGTADAATASTAYTGTGLKWQVTDELLRESETQYDEAGRPVTMLGAVLTDGTRPQTTLSYDLAGNVAEKHVLQSPGVESVWTYHYDGRNRKVEEVLPADANGEVARTLVAYDAVGNVAAVRDARGNVTDNTYDAANRLIKVEAPLVTLADGTNVRPTVNTTYDAAGNVLTVTDPNNHVTTNTYDALNRLSTTTDGALITVQNTYDASNNIVTVKDGKLQTTAFEYDGLNRNTKITDHQGGTTQFAYNAMNKTTRTDARGWITQYGYDGRNRLTAAVSLLHPADDRGFSYDAIGNLLAVGEPNKAGKADVAYTYDALNRVKTETSSGVTHAYAYDLAGNRTLTLYGGTNRVMESYFDGRNRLLEINERLAGQPIEAGRLTDYGYDATGNVVVKILPNGDRVDMTYDALNRAQVIQGRAPPVGQNQSGLLLYCYAQSYDRTGNVARIEETYRDTTANRILEMGYDGANRLLTEKATDAQNAITTTTYGYDAANNRTSKAVASPGSTLTTSYTYNSLNQLTTATPSTGPETTYTYDANGSRATRTQTGVTDNYSYDLENRLTTVTKNGIEYDYTYDYRTRRVERTEDGPATRVVFSGGISIQEIVGNAITVEYVRGSDYGGGVRGILYSVRGNALSYTHYDGRGDVTAKTDDGGNLTYQASYEAFGTRTRETGTTRDHQKANTKEEDPTGLLNEGMRYRDLEAGVFITRDPAGFVDGPNLYTYIRQNPWTSFDPEGLMDGTTAEGFFSSELSLRLRLSPSIAKAAPWVARALGSAAIVYGAFQAGYNLYGPSLASELDHRLSLADQARQNQQAVLYRLNYIADYGKPPPFDVPGYGSTTPLSPISAPGYGSATPATPIAAPGYGSATPVSPISAPGYGSTTPLPSLDESIQICPDSSAFDIQVKSRNLNGPTSVYIGDDGYIGITNDFDRRQEEWARLGRQITELHSNIDRMTARGIEQILIERGRKAGNPVNLEQRNSIDPSRTDQRAEEMRQRGSDYLQQSESE